MWIGRSTGHTAGKQSEKWGEWQVRASCRPESNGVLGKGMLKNFLTAP